MDTFHERSAVAHRRRYIIQQLERLRTRLIRKSPACYPNENTYQVQLRRTRALISEFEGELFILDCPGEYYQLPAAVVADELGLTYKQVRELIKLGEIAAVGSQAHEIIERDELERIAAMGTPELLRLGRQEAAEIFEQSIPYLKRGEVEEAQRAHRRLEARQSWRGAYAPAFLVGLEVLQGDFEGAFSSIRLIHECEDMIRRLATLAQLTRLFREMGVEEREPHQLCRQLVALIELGLNVHQSCLRHKSKC
jgi:hypothetical protein